jgi:acetoin utilization protein AcuB
MLGLLRTSCRLDLLLENKPAVLEATSRLIQEAGGKIINVALGPTQAGKRSYYFRLAKCDLTPIMDTLKKHGHRVVDFIP